MSEKSIKAECTTIIEEIHNPSYKQLDEFVAKCVREHKV